jgi:hypothetical protein
LRGNEGAAECGLLLVEFDDEFGDALSRVIVLVDRLVDELVAVVRHDAACVFVNRKDRATQEVAGSAVLLNLAGELVNLGRRALVDLALFAESNGPRLVVSDHAGKAGVFGVGGFECSKCVALLGEKLPTPSAELGEFFCRLGLRGGEEVGKRHVKVTQVDCEFLSRVASSAANCSWCCSGVTGSCVVRERASSR